jgi:hypothetical protein
MKGSLDVMRDINVTGKERFFGDDDIIVSKTDLKGHLTYCNKVFQLRILLVCSLTRLGSLAFTCAALPSILSFINVYVPVFFREVIKCYKAGPSLLLPWDIWGSYLPLPVMVTKNLAKNGPYYHAKSSMRSP